MPRLFLEVESPLEVGQTIELPKEEVDKLRKVLRLGAGAHIAILPGDGHVCRATFLGRDAEVTSIERLDTESSKVVTLAQALPKGDKLDEVVRMGTEIGVARFLLFPSERSVVRWDAAKVQDRLRRLRAISREAAEVSFRSKLASIESRPSLSAVLEDATCIVLSEVEGVVPTLSERAAGAAVTLVVGPEGGWSRSEVALIGDRAVTLGPRVLRVDTAACAAAAIVLLS